MPLYMRILLDCRTLSTDPPEAEKRLLVSTFAALLTRKRGVEWLFVVDKRYPDVLPQPNGRSLTAGRWKPGRAGGGLWARWEWSRIVKKVQPGLTMRMEELLLVPGAADDLYRPLANEEKEAVKMRYADGKEYFLSDVSGARAEEIVELLKAFSLFKKRQRSNLQLVLRSAGAVRGQGISLRDKLITYKYRSDVHLSEEPDGQAWRELVAAAYAFLLPSDKEGRGQGLAIFNAWKTGTPVISGDAACLQRAGGSAALYARQGDPASMAALLMSLYTNESLRAEMIGKGLDRLRSFDWERSAEQVWEGILRAANQQ